MSQIFKSGKYYIGDLCYVLNNDNWDELLNKTNYFTNKAQEFKGKIIFVADRTYGDGAYEDNFGREYSVDSGSIGIIPVEIIDKNTAGGHIIDFSKDFEVGIDNGIFFCDTIKIQIRDEDGLEYEETECVEESYLRHVYENVNYPIAQRIIESTNNIIGGGNSFFDRAEESLLSMFIFYFKEVEKKESISEVLLGVNNILENINNIEDFHNLFIDIKDESLNSVYTKSSFYATYTDYSKRSVGMTKEEASKKNGWLLNGFNETLSGLKCRFKRTDIGNLIKTEEIKSSVINKANEIVCGELDLDKWNKPELEYLLALFSEAINNKLGNEQDLNVIYLAQGRLERVLSKKHSTFISKVQTLFKDYTKRN